MTDAAVTELALQMMIAGAKLSAPMLITALVVGFAVSLFQAVTQLQDSTLAFVPKTRRPTKPTRGSQIRRVDAKIQRGRIKALRGRGGADESR